MSCPATLTYPETFDPAARPRAVAALLSASAAGIIAPPDGQRWFQADLNELVTRHWVVQHQMRVDRLWFYKLTEAGVAQRDSLLADGWNFDGFDAWLHETLMRAA